MAPLVEVTCVAMHLGGKLELLKEKLLRLEEDLILALQMTGGQLIMATSELVTSEGLLTMAINVLEKLSRSITTETDISTEVALESTETASVDGMLEDQMKTGEDSHLRRLKTGGLLSLNYIF